MDKDVYDIKYLGEPYRLGDTIKPRMRFYSKFTQTIVEIASVESGSGKGSLNLVVQRILDTGKKSPEQWVWTVPKFAKQDSTSKARCDLGGWYHWHG